MSEVRDLGAEFVRREVVPHLQEWEDAGSIPRELHLAAGKQGLLGVAFPEEVGGENAGFYQIAEQFVVERIALAVHAYGIATRSLELAAAYCRDRETFGRPLIANQVVRHKLVEMRRQVEVARTYARHVAERHVRGENVVAEACLAKQTACDAATYVCDQAVQLHGGTGYMHGTEVERHYRDARILPIGGGATEVLTDLAARLLGYTA
jgi:acyl-CoA dehydrogenase